MPLQLYVRETVEREILIARVHITKKTKRPLEIKTTFKHVRFVASVNLKISFDSCIRKNNPNVLNVLE